MTIVLPRCSHAHTTELVTRSSPDNFALCDIASYGASKGTDLSLVHPNMDQNGAATLLLMCNILNIAPLVLCNDEPFKIIGGYVDVYNDDTTVYYKRTRRWGTYLTAGFPDRKAVEINSNYCWNNGRAYCYMYFVVSTSSDPAEEHYQLMGSKMVIKDKSSTYEIDSYGWGVQDTFDKIERKEVTSGVIWSDALKDWGFGYLSLFVRKEARPSHTDAFFREYRKAGDEQFKYQTTYIGQKNPSSTSELLSTFSAFTNPWGDGSVQFLEVYTIPTKLIDSTTLYDEKVSKPLDIPVLKSLTMENYGSGATSDDFALIGTSETFTISTEATISTSFEFAIDVGNSMTIDAAGIGISMSVNLHSAYSSSSEQKETKTETKTQTIQWPSTCPAGMRVKHIVTTSSEEVKIPIVFTFERGDLRWTERKILEATMSNLKQEKHDCCLWADAHELCGTTGLPVCSQ